MYSGGFIMARVNSEGGPMSKKGKPVTPPEAVIPEAERIARAARRLHYVRAVSLGPIREGTGSYQSGVWYVQTVDGIDIIVSSHRRRQVVHITTERTDVLFLDLDL